MSWLYLATATDAVLRAGAIQREKYGKEIEISHKGEIDLVTEVDRAAETAILAAIRERFPDHDIVTEETVLARTGSRFVWFVDPLDGTTNFLHGLPSVGVAIALVEGNRPVVGVVAAPLLGEVYAARLGGGATRNGAPVRVSDRSPDAAICATGFPFRNKQRLDPFLGTFEAVLRSVEDIRRVGAASMDLAWTGSGVFDGYFELSLGTWDVAAGGLIVREAGGVVTDWRGDDEQWLWTGDVVAGNPVVHAHLVEITTQFRG